MRQSNQSSICRTLTVRFCPTGTDYQVQIREGLTVGDVIADVCQQANIYQQTDCYLLFESRELDPHDTIINAGLHRISLSNRNRLEVRLKYLQLLETSQHIGKQVLLASSQNVLPDQLFDHSFPSTTESILPSILKPLVGQILRAKRHRIGSVSNDNDILIPLPNFTQGVIESLPTIKITVPLSPIQFDWNEFMECLSMDLGIQLADLIIVDVKEGSTTFMLKLRAIFSQVSETLKKIMDKVLFMLIPKCQQFVDHLLPSNTLKATGIKIELENFAKQNGTINDAPIPPDEIDLALRLSERPGIVHEKCWKFLEQKSRMISIGLLQSFQDCAYEYVIDHASLVYNEQLGEKYLQSENLVD
ncbi:unnamed protein product, partial [Rotaria sp. Silwood1]